VTNSSWIAKWQRLSFVLMVRDRVMKRQEAISIVMVGVIGLAVLAPKLYAQFTVREESGTVRLLQYESALRMIRDHPFLGVGLNNSTRQKRQYSTLTYHSYDPDTQLYLEPTHNLCLATASEIGAFGALLFVAFFSRVRWVAWRESRQSSDSELKWAANAFFVAFCSVGLNGFMEPLREHPVLILLWLYAGVALNLPRMAQRPEAALARGPSPRLSSAKP
jgi:O-antigen ligase